MTPAASGIVALTTTVTATANTRPPSAAFQRRNGPNHQTDVRFIAVPPFELFDKQPTQSDTPETPPALLGTKRVGHPLRARPRTTADEVGVPALTRTGETKRSGRRDWR